MNEMKKLLDELTDAAIEGVFKNEKLTVAITRYCRDIYSNLVLRGFNHEEAFQITKILISQSYIHSNK